MSIDFFQDLLRTLMSLLKANSCEDASSSENGMDDYELHKKPLLGNYEILKCIEAVFSILSGQGDQLTIDPSTFYGYLSRTIAELSILDCEEILSNTSSEKCLNKNIYTLLFTLHNILQYLLFDQYWSSSGLVHNRSFLFVSN